MIMILLIIRGLGVSVKHIYSYFFRTGVIVHITSHYTLLLISCIEKICCKNMTSHTVLTLIVLLTFFKLMITIAAKDFLDDSLVFEPTTTKMDLTTEEDMDINAKNRKSEILSQLLETGYDTKVRPLGINGSGPVNIYIDISFRSIENIDDTKMEYTAQLLFRQRWGDPRLAYSRIESNIKYLQLLDQSRIWGPDVFFDNEKTGELHSLVLPNVFTRIYPNGTVLQSYRFTILLSCPMDLHAYPLDIQVCPLRMASFGYTTKDTILEWHKFNPVQYDHFIMPQFNIVSFKPNICSSVTLSGNYSCIGVDIKVKRAFGFFLIQIYIPCAMLVLVSWVSFWLEPSAVEARVSLGVTAILTIVTQTYGINKSAPPASYIKALDVWTALCQFLVFGGLLQFALVNYLSRLSDPLSMIKRIRTFAHQAVASNDGEEVDAKESPSKVESRDDQLQKCLQRAKRVDRIARVGFPTFFLLFNIAYWTSYGLIY